MILLPESLEEATNNAALDDGDSFFVFVVSVPIIAAVVGVVAVFARRRVRASDAANVDNAPRGNRDALVGLELYDRGAMAVAVVVADVFIIVALVVVDRRNDDFMGEVVLDDDDDDGVPALALALAAADTDAFAAATTERKGGEEESGVYAEEVGVLL